MLTDGAQGGHTGAVMARRALLAAEGAEGFMTLPGDIPHVTPPKITQVLAAHRPRPAFTIVPAHDDFGSNAVLCSPPTAVPLRFGDNSFFPHLDAARRCGIEPTVLRLPGIALDIDNAGDLARFMAPSRRSTTRTVRFLESLTVPTGAAPQDDRA